MKRASDGMITLTQNGVDRIARMNNDTIDRMTWELMRYNYSAGFGTERLYAFVVRKYANPEPSHGSWGSEEHKITVPDDYPTIQAAINAASDGDTVFARNGVYRESVDVNKSLNIVGAGSSETIICASNSSDHVFEVTANYVNITGFTIANASQPIDPEYPTIIGIGIVLYAVNNCNIFGNVLLASGIRFGDSSFNSVSGNIVASSAVYGVLLLGQSNNNFFCNNVVNNTTHRIGETYVGVGFYCQGSNNVFKNNMIG
jgi:parallel beta-helix repeat protein